MARVERFLFIAEIVVCFGPAAVWLMYGVAMVPAVLALVAGGGMAFVDLTFIFLPVAGGILGLVALSTVARAILQPRTPVRRPVVTAIFAVLGLLTLTSLLLVSGNIWIRIILLAPIAATIHLAHLWSNIRFRKTARCE